MRTDKSTDVAIPVEPINRLRSKHVDFIIECRDDDNKIFKYGVEKAVLASMATYFDKADLKDQAVFRTAYRPKFARKFLQVCCTGIVEPSVWSVEDWSSLIEIGTYYECERVEIYGLHQFCCAILALLAEQDTEILEETKYGKRLIVKFFKLWFRGVKGNLSWTNDVEQAFQFTCSQVVPAWFKLYDLEEKPENLMELGLFHREDYRCFGGLDAEICYRSIMKYLSTKSSADISKVFQEYDDRDYY